MTFFPSQLILFLITILLTFSSTASAENPKEIVEEILSRPEYQQDLPDWTGNLPNLPTDQLLEALGALPIPETEAPAIADDGGFFSFLRGCIGSEQTYSNDSREESSISAGDPRTPSKARNSEKTSFLQGCAGSQNKERNSNAVESDDDISVTAGNNGRDTNPQNSESRERNQPNIEISSFLKFFAGLIVCSIILAILFRFMQDKEEPQIASPISSPLPVQDNDKKTEKKSDQHLISAEDLATQGRYSEAIHLLLLRSIALLRDQVPQSDFLTAREISRKSTINHKAKLSFGKVLSTAELAHFGGRTLGLEEYQSCVKHYQIFLQYVS